MPFSSFDFISIDEHQVFFSKLLLSMILNFKDSFIYIIVPPVCRLCESHRTKLYPLILSSVSNISLVAQVSEHKIKHGPRSLTMSSTKGLFLTILCILT